MRYAIPLLLLTGLAGRSDEAPLPAAEEQPALTLGHRPRQPGERFEIASVAEVKLQAEVGNGILAQKLSYDLREEERLDVTVLPSDDEGRRAARLTYPLRRATTTAPLVGRKTKDRRVAGLSFVAREAADGLGVFDGEGDAPTRDKEARYVRASWLSLELEPALTPLLGDEPLTPGRELVADGALARAILGLPLEQLTPSALTLTVVGAAEDGTVRLELSAELEGQAELGGQGLRFTGTLRGPLFLDPATGRALRMDLSGDAVVEADDPDAFLAARGEGTLSLRRMVRELDPEGR